MKPFAGLAVLLLVAGCSQAAKTTDPYAGLDAAILAWKTTLAASDISCKRAPAGETCDTFEVACKAQRPITPKEQASGVTAKLIADMTWSGFDDKGAPQPASAAALFEKAGGGWMRSPAKAVNPQTCADL
jgi:hypothetical protein